MLEPTLTSLATSRGVGEAWASTCQACPRVPGLVALVAEVVHTQAGLQQVLDLGIGVLGCAWSQLINDGNWSMVIVSGELKVNEWLIIT